MTEKVRAILRVVASAGLMSEEYRQLSKVLWTHHIAMEQMKPLDAILDEIMDKLKMSKEEKEFVLDEKLDFERP